jgi:peptide/nickel transport system permease protein
MHAGPGHAASTFRRMRRHTAVLLAGAVLLTISLLAVFAPWVSRQQLGDVDLDNLFAAPIWAGGSWQYPLGTDQLGRDMVTSLTYGARVSLAAALMVMVIGGAFGSLVGMTAGLSGGWFDVVVGRTSEVALSLPQIVIGLVLFLTFGKGFWVVVAVIASTSWVPYARVIRAEVSVMRNSEFVALAVVGGLSRRTIIFRHILPNVMPTIIVLAAMGFGHVILLEASLSFIGLGIQPPQSSWGLMIANYDIYLVTDPWLLLAPSAALVMTSLSSQLIGDGLREWLDPRLEERG